MTGNGPINLWWLGDGTFICVQMAAQFYPHQKGPNVYQPSPQMRWRYLSRFLQRCALWKKRLQWRCEPSRIGDPFHPKKHHLFDREKTGEYKSLDLGEFAMFEESQLMYWNHQDPNHWRICRPRKICQWEFQWYPLVMQQFARSYGHGNRWFMMIYLFEKCDFPTFSSQKVPLCPSDFFDFWGELYHQIRSKKNHHYLVAHPTNRKWVITPVIKWDK